MPAGNENKEKLYRALAGPRGFLAQGSELGFDKPYARGINDEVLVCFTPQDGNSLLSSMAAALWLIEPDWQTVNSRLNPVRRWLYREI